MPVVACIADIHIGHRAAMWPENYTDVDGKTLVPSKPQKLLNQYWHDFWTSPEAKDAEFVLNLAESLEGNNRKEYGRSLVEPDLDLQANAFVHCLAPYIQGKRYISLTGSGYHGSLDSQVETGIAKQLRLKENGGIQAWAKDGMMIRSVGIIMMIDDKYYYLVANIDVKRSSDRTVCGAINIPRGDITEVNILKRFKK